MADPAADNRTPRASQLLYPGDAAPWFHAAALDGNPRYAFDTAAGRPVVLLFAGSAGEPAVRAALRLIVQHRALFDDVSACFFGVSTDPEDVARVRIAQMLPGIRWFLDHDGAISRRYGALDATGDYNSHWLLLDPGLRIVRREPIGGGARIVAALAQLIADSRSAGDEAVAPVLTVPRVIEPALCRRLIDLYEAEGGQESGFMREENGITVTRTDYGHKRRSDLHLDDPELVGGLRARLHRFLKPMIQRAFQFEVTRVERWLVACYDGDAGGGHFRAHRDNTTKGTAHRRFACTINLNADDYDGGALRFPEYGPRTYHPPTGGALVFSCSLLHEALPVTRGRRYAFLPFFYDEEAAKLRERNLAFVSPELAGYRSGLPDAE